MQKLQIPILGIDEVVSAIPTHMSKHANPFWDDMINILLYLTESQLNAGLSVVVDSVFMGDDRRQAFEIARKHKVEFRPIHTFVSDENVWQDRIQRRYEEAPPDIKDVIATWGRLQEQRKDFHPWKPGTALFVDGMNSIEDNTNKVIEFITAPQVNLELL